MQVVDTVQNEAFASTYRSSHIANHDIVEHGERSVAHEEQVRDGQQGIRVFINKGDVFEADAFNKLAREVLGRQRFQVGSQEAFVLGLAYAINHGDSDVFHLQNVSQQIANLVHLGSFLQYALEIAVFFLRHLHIQDIAE